MTESSCDCDYLIWPFIYANHFDRTGIKATACKTNIFSIFTSICPKYYCTQLNCVKTVVEKFSFSELKIEKVNLFTHSPTKLFCIIVFNHGGCFGIYLTFRPFLTLGPKQLGCLYKKSVYVILKSVTISHSYSHFHKSIVCFTFYVWLQRKKWNFFPRM